jgi:hypothetical protein
MYIMNINAPSEFTYESDIDLGSGDEFLLQAKFNDIELYFNIPYDTTNSYIKSVRNSVIKFDNLILPCQGLSLHLKEKDIIRADDFSNSIQFDCSEIGPKESEFQIGDALDKGLYRMLSVVSSVDDTSFDQSYSVYSPVDIGF